MTSRRTGGFRAGLTIVELLVIVVVIVILIGILLPAMGPHHHGGTRTLKDSSQVRGVLQGLTLWAQSNQDRYPLPSRLDAANATVAEGAEAKDTTANIMSVLIFNSFFPPELFVSPAEANGNIVRFENYQLKNPATAIDPAHALWDPAFRADFTSGEGNVSYAHTLPRGQPAALDLKTERWGATYIANQPALGNRGPEITAITRARDGSVTPTYRLGKGTGSGGSLTFLIHGSRVKWEGNIGYNDNHVNFETSEAPESLTYTLPDGKAQRDVLFFDEPDAPSGNSFLGIFTTGGREKADFKCIWD